MDRSSPLAAMQPSSQPFGHWGTRRDTQPIFRPMIGKDLGYSSGSFNFADLSFGTSSSEVSSDYFSLKPVRGSSPTSSLAVDLSQNCHIDQSPLPATPRRSLFPSKSIGILNKCLVPLTESSSPFRTDDSMDISPLPHKTPFFRAASVPAITPIPVDISVSSSQLMSPNCIPESPLGNSKPKVPFERRRPTMLRPALSRAKTQATSVLSIKSAGIENSFPSFKFGGGSSGSTTTTTTTLDTLAECFVDSSPQNPFATRNTNYVSNSKARGSFACPNASRPINASPCSSINRKSGAPIQRPRKQFRRSLSMYENPSDFMKTKPEPLPECNLNSIMDSEDTHKSALPHFMADEETIPRITKEVMIDVLDGKYRSQFDQTIIVDCRFEYEYNGGHIEGAINFNDKEELTKKLFEGPVNEKTLVILHCEYSAHRAPIAARHIRYKDRAANAHQYPKLTFPELYILDGGYSSFYKDYQVRCFPQNYIEMNDKAHSDACEKGLGRMKQQRTKIGRAQTFAFGQQQQQMLGGSSSILQKYSAIPENSSDDIIMGMDGACDYSPEQRRMHSRRIASY